MKKVYIILAALLLTACKTRERVVTIETTRTDTTYITKHQRDSIWLHDSVYISEHQRGDTIYIERNKWKTKYIERIVRDTLYISARDSVPVPYPVEVEVPAKLNRAQRLLIGMGRLAIVGIIFAGIFFFLKLRRF